MDGFMQQEANCICSTKGKIIKLLPPFHHHHPLQALSGGILLFIATFNNNLNFINSN